jgi:hypothetical protein
MFKNTGKQIMKFLSNYKINLTEKALFILLLIVLLSSCCIGLYGINKIQEGLANQNSDNDTTAPPGTLEPGTGRPFLPGVNTPQTSNGNGIPASQIPTGDEDLYILKSQIVPPVCPKCPVVINKCENNEKKCPPCPACARCPEPNFECKKVPNYKSSNTELPLPLLNDFSQF